MPPCEFVPFSVEFVNRAGFVRLSVGRVLTVLCAAASCLDKPCYGFVNRQSYLLFTMCSARAVGSHVFWLPQSDVVLFGSFELCFEVYLLTDAFSTNHTLRSPEPFLFAEFGCSLMGEKFAMLSHFCSVPTQLCFALMFPLVQSANRTSRTTRK